jgi:hypothetical protein
MVTAIGKRHQEFEDSIKCVRIHLLAALQPVAQAAQSA